MPRQLMICSFSIYRTVMAGQEKDLPIHPSQQDTEEIPEKVLSQIHTENEIYNKICNRLQSRSAGKSRNKPLLVGQTQTCMFCGLNIKYVSSLYRHYGTCKKLTEIMSTDPSQVSDKIKSIRESQKDTIDKIKQLKKLRKMYIIGECFVTECVICNAKFSDTLSMYKHFSQNHGLVM